MSSFDTTIYPVGFCISPYTSTHFQVLPSESRSHVATQQDVESRLAEFGLDQDTFSTALITQITTLQASFNVQRSKLNRRIQTLITTNTALQLQKTTSQTQSEGILLLRDERITTLEEQNKKMKEEMDKLIAKQAEENKMMQKRLDDAISAKQQALAAAQTIWDKTEQLLWSRIHSLTSQVNTLQTNLNIAEKEKIKLISDNATLDSQLVALRTTVDSLQKAVNEEPVRQQAAIKARIAEVRQKILNRLDRDIEYYNQLGGPSSQNGKFYDRETSAWALQNARNVIARLLTD